MSVTLVVVFLVTLVIGVPIAFTMVIAGLAAVLVQGSLNKLCVGLPVKANAQGILGLIGAVGVAQDIPVLSAPQNQQCAENSTQAKGDEPASHILDDACRLLLDLVPFDEMAAGMTDPIAQQIHLAALRRAVEQASA